MRALVQSLVIVCAAVCCYFPGFIEMNNDFAMKPRNRAALENSTTILNCASNRSSGVNGTMHQDWAFKPINGDERILSPGGNSSSYSRTEPGQNDLIIRKTSFQDAGTYRCVSSLNYAWSAEVIVLRPSPSCHIVSEPLIDGDHAQVQCHLVYRGGHHMSPKIEWNFNKNVFFTVSEVVESPGSDTLISTVTFNATRQTSLSYRVALLNSTNFPSQHANNVPSIPSNLAVWTLIKLNVLYSSKIIKFSPPGERFYPGEIITCSMVSNPKAEYFWTNLTSGKRFSKLEIDESHISSMIHRINCTATVNIIERNISWVSSRTLAFMVNEKNSNTGIWIALAIAGVGSLVAFIVAIILIWRKILKKTRTGNTSKYGKVNNSEMPVTSDYQMVCLDAHLYDEIAIATDHADARESLQLPNGDVLQPYDVIRDNSDQNENNWTSQYVGKDGTVYTALRSNQSTDGTGSNPPSKEKQNFPTAVYANIAHDLEVSPPS